MINLATFTSVVRENPGQFLGWLIIAGLVAQVGLMALGGARRVRYERRRGELEQERLALEIRAAKLRIQTVEQAKSAWNGIRKFKVARKVAECADTFSFYLRPHDGKPLPPFKPGQYLTFQLPVPGQPRPIIRCYSLSDSPHHPDYYRVSIKRCPAPKDKPEILPGLSSNFFHDHVSEGDIVDVKAPSGHFFLDLNSDRPVVLIGGGIGVTPVMSMLNALTESKSQREIWFFLGIRHSGEHCFREHLARVTKDNPNVKLHVCYSDPLEKDKKGTDYTHGERVSVELFKKVLPSSNYVYHICGPPPMMQSLVKDLDAWGVPEKDVLFEAFGPASVKKASKPADAAPPPAECDITFKKSGKKITWKSTDGTLLEFGEANKVSLDSGCRAGNCGTCKVALLAGEVSTVTTPSFQAEGGSCLTCVLVPKGALTLDA